MKSLWQQIVICVLVELPFNDQYILWLFLSSCNNFAILITSRTFLAALHWNENGNRPQAVKKDGTGQYKVAYPKPKEGDFVVKKVLTECTYGMIICFILHNM